MCPFSTAEWNETHNSSKSLNTNNVQNNTQKEIENNSETQVKENLDKNLPNNTAKKNGEEKVITDKPANSSNNAKDTSAIESNISNDSTNKEQSSITKTNTQPTKETEKCNTDNCPHKNIKKEAPWIKIAEEELKKYRGQKESSKDLYNRIKNKYFPDANFGNDRNPTKVAWCAAFVTYCMKTAGYKNSSNPSVGGYDWGVAPRPGLPKRGWFEGEKTEPFTGAIGIFKFKGGYSHVAILVGKRKNGMLVFLGGNQNNEINKTAYEVSRIDYFMKPKNYTVSPEEKELPIIMESQNAGSIG